MKNPRTLLALALLTPLCLPAQSPDDAAPASAAAAPTRRPAEIEQLVAPIALYPDALVALILPAANAPADIVLAARQVRATGSDRSQIEHRSWDESVKSLTSYPEVLQWMDENLQWTKQIGEAFAEQPVEVMQAIQRLRAKARAAGTLADTPQQTVLSEADVIRIVPAQASTIYVPYYQPEVVFVDRPVFVSRPFVSFGAGVAVGSWLAFDCDWHRHTIWVGSRHRPWSGHDWRRPLVVAPVVARPSIVQVHSVRPWTPPPRPSRPTVVVAPPGPRDPRPAPPRPFTPRPSVPTETAATYRPAPPNTARDVNRPHDPSPGSPRVGDRGHRGSIPEQASMPPAVTAPPLPTAPERSGPPSTPTTIVRSHGYPGAAREVAPSRTRSGNIAASLQPAPSATAAPAPTTPVFRSAPPSGQSFPRTGARPAPTPPATEATPPPATARSADPAGAPATQSSAPASRRGGPPNERGIGRPDPNAQER